MEVDFQDIRLLWLPIATLIFMTGVVYARILSLTRRVSNIEEWIQEATEFRERLATIEAKLDMLLHACPAANTKREGSCSV